MREQKLSSQDFLKEEDMAFRIEVKTNDNSSIETWFYGKYAATDYILDLLDRMNFADSIYVENPGSISTIIVTRAKYKDIDDVS